MMKVVISAITLSMISVSASAAAAPSAATVKDIMAMFGTKGETAFSATEIANMGRPFSQADLNSDGYLTETEYVSSSRHFRNNPKGARGFLKASDLNGDNLISHSEYIQNRIVTDEAKMIFAQIDPTQNTSSSNSFGWTLDRTSFSASAYLGNSDLANVAFDAMDADADGILTLPEYLMTYGRWARTALPAEQLDGA